MNNIITTEDTGNYYSYTCNISKSLIIFEKNIEDKYITINNTDFNWNDVKLVLNLLNFSFNDIISKLKNTNIKYFRYTIMKTDTKLLDMTKWQIIKDNNVTIDLQCNLDDCFENVMKGFIHNQ